MRRKKKHNKEVEKFVKCSVAYVQVSKCLPSKKKISFYVYTKLISDIFISFTFICVAYNRLGIFIQYEKRSCHASIYLSFIYDCNHFLLCMIFKSIKYNTKRITPIPIEYVAKRSTRIVKRLGVNNPVSH